MQQIHQGYQHKSFKEENSKTKLGEFQRQTKKKIYAKKDTLKLVNKGTNEERLEFKTK
jgi:hypothetical protein